MVALHGEALVRVECDRARLSLLEFANAKNTRAVSSKIFRGLTESVLTVDFLSSKGYWGLLQRRIQKIMIISAAWLMW